MPSIGLLLSEPSVTFRNGQYGSDGWRISFKAKLANSYIQHVDLTTDEGDMEKLDGNVAFEPFTKEPYLGFEKGSLTYWKGSDDIVSPLPPNYLATMRMSESDLARLMQTIADGLPLSSVNITVEDMQYGWEPDGSGKKWDNAAKPGVEINGYNLYFGNPEEEEIVPDPPEATIDSGLTALTAIREASRLLRYVLYVLVALLVVAIIRR